MSLLDLIIALMVAALVAVVTTPLAARVAASLGIIDRPNDRKASRRGGIPLLGGLAVAAGSFAGLAVLYFRESDDLLSGDQLPGFVAGAVVLILVGVWDDRFDLGAWQKLPFQLLAAAIAVEAGFAVEYFSNPFAEDAPYLVPAWLKWPITLGWIMVVTNAMNLMDGLDGLATGIGAIIAATLTVICWQADQTSGLVIGVIMLGALLGFLPFNFPPARIFLGDAGALFIGYCLALASIQGYRKAALLTFLVPLLALAVPLLDTLLSVFRRLRSGKAIFSADDMHIHHRLLRREGSTRQAVLWLYFQTACFGIIAISFSQLKSYSAIIFLVAVAILTIRLLKNLGLFEPEPLPSVDSDNGVESGAASDAESHVEADEQS